MDKKLKMILAAMGKVTGLSKAEIEQKLSFDDTTDDVAFQAALDEVLDTHTDAVKTKTGKDYSDGHKAAKKDVMTELETQLRDKFPNIKSTAKGLALIEQIVADTSSASGDPAKLDEDAVKKHPAYLQLEKDSQKAIETAKQEGESKLKEVQDGLKRDGYAAKFETEAMTEFDALGPILGENETAAAKRREVFRKSLKEIPREYDEQGNALLVDAKGARLEDKFGKPAKLNEVVKNHADEYGFEYRVAKPRTSSGTGKPGDKPEAEVEKASPKYTGQLPANDAEYMKFLNDESINDEAKSEVMTAYKGAKNS